MKGVLHTSYAPPGSQPLSREEQVKSLNDHVKACLLAGEGGSVYVSGLPGTGLQCLSSYLHICIRSEKPVFEHLSWRHAKNFKVSCVYG